METGKARGKRNHVIQNKKINLLRFAAIYGANSAGKTNLVKAISFARALVTGRVSGSSISREYYNRTKVENKEKPTQFKFEFLIQNKIYEYAFSILLKERKFLSESLLCNEKLIFFRDLEKKEFSLDIKLKDLDKRKKINLFFETVCEIDTVLFLQDMNTNKGTLYETEDEASIFKTIYDVFNKSIETISPNTKVSSHNILFEKERNVEKLLEQFGFDITNIEYKEDVPENIFRGVPQELVEDILKDIDEKFSDDAECLEIMLHGPRTIVKIEKEDDKFKYSSLIFRHGNYGEFTLTEESDGFQRIIQLIEILLNPQKGKIYIIDELDRSLNAHLSKAFIDFFLNEAEEQNVQLIITTHETRLLDLNLLRKDEIWMFDKVDGSTTITALTDFNTPVRSDVKLDSAYMDGKYGGIPRVKRGDA